MVLDRTILRRLLLGLGGVAAALALIWFGMHALAKPIVHLADANDNAKVLPGRHAYRLYCSSCHGRLLQGQAHWQLRDKDAYKRAPAHDETGHTWQHSDEELFHITKYGRAESAPQDMVSFMPAFKDRLTDEQILAIIAFIKRGWPIGLRASQATLNPGYAGMPPEASRVAWKFPPTCGAALEPRGIKSVDRTLAPKPGLVVEGFGDPP
jgi:S-disulfanyl-L-cysteine oxidoreductase SoxD